MTRISCDLNGTPGVMSETVVGAYWGLGWLHGYYRPMQTLLLTTAARGEMSRRLVAKDDLVHMDALVHRHGIIEAGKRSVDQLPNPVASWVDAYLMGISSGLRKAPLPWEFRMLATKIPAPDRASLISSMLIAGFLGLAESQERMERALIESVREGADASLLEAMFSPHLSGWDPHVARDLSISEAVGSSNQLVFPVSGSNAWAVDSRWTNSSKPILAGDPHLQISQIPGLFFETRVQVEDNYWLGATIPGLPGFAVGRNKHLAWAGTFGVADNVDFFIEEVRDGKVKVGPDTWRAPDKRRVKLKRRFKTDLSMDFWDTPTGTLEGDLETEGKRLSSKWSSSLRPWETVAAFLTLPTCASSVEAEKCLETAHSLSLHFVTADIDDDVRFFHLGMLPQREYSGLYPVSAFGDTPPWNGRRFGRELPRWVPDDGLVATANEELQFEDGNALSTMSQADYRLRRILGQLRARSDHGFDSMRALQLDVYSLQAQQLAPLLLKWLPNGPVRSALSDWDYCYAADSRGAHAFEVAYDAARRGLGQALGGAWFESMLDMTEIGSWWLRPIDRVLNSDSLEQSPWFGAITRRVADIHNTSIEKWGDVQELQMPNLILDFLPRWTGFKKGPFPLEGGRATPRQGQLIPTRHGESALGPAYRMISDLAEDCIWTSLPGGISGNPLNDSSSKWLQEWLDGSYHRLAPPTLDEATLPFDILSS